MYPITADSPDRPAAEEHNSQTLFWRLREMISGPTMSISRVFISMWQVLVMVMQINSQPLKGRNNSDGETRASEQKVKVAKATW